MVEPSKFRSLVWEMRFQLKEKKIPNVGCNTLEMLVSLDKVNKFLVFLLDSYRNLNRQFGK